MIKKTQFLTATLLVILIASIAYTAIPNAKASELTIQQKTISTLNNIVDLDTSKYDAAITQSPNDLYKNNLLKREHTHYPMFNRKQVRHIVHFHQWNITEDLCLC